MSETDDGRRTTDDGRTVTTTERTTERTTQGGANQPGADQVSGFTDLGAANREIARLRAESAGRRVDNRDLQGQIDDLKKQVPSAGVQSQIDALQTQVQRYQAAGEAGVSSELLTASEELRGATTADEMKAASEKLARLVAAGSSTARNPAPPREPSQPPSRDEQLRAASKDGNMREVQRLNAEKLADLSGGGG